MQLNICVRAEDDASIRSASTQEELHAAITGTLGHIEGPCLTSVAALSRLSIPTVYAIRRGVANPTLGTLIQLATTLAPGYVIALTTTCPVRVFSWAPHEVPGYEREIMNGSRTGLERCVLEGWVHYYKDGQFLRSERVAQRAASA